MVIVNFSVIDDITRCKDTDLGGFPVWSILLGCSYYNHINSSHNHSGALTLTTDIIIISRPVARTTIVIRLIIITTVIKEFIVLTLYMIIATTAQPFEERKKLQDWFCGTSL